MLKCKVVPVGYLLGGVEASVDRGKLLSRPAISLPKGFKLVLIEQLWPSTTVKGQISTLGYATLCYTALC